VAFESIHHAVWVVGAKAVVGDWLVQSNYLRKENAPRRRRSRRVAGFLKQIAGRQNAGRKCKQNIVKITLVHHSPRYVIKYSRFFGLLNSASNLNAIQQ